MVKEFDRDKYISECYAQGMDKCVVKKQEPVALTEKDILTILQNAQSVPLGSPMWESGAEHDKLVKIIHSAINYTAPRELSYDEIIQIACDEFYGLIKKEERNSFIRFARAILKKAREK